ncbi:MAG: SIR2 family protein [Halobacteriota archaeon]|jgi:tetratricopeptide (TPR) repeat protein/NAD-dependent SIR2 family protein deacetylase
MEEIKKRLLAGEVALFCGAGISKNSGLPLADELKRSILETLLQTKQDVKQSMRVPYPFEAFLQSVFDPGLVSGMRLNSMKILEIFRHGEPNSNHVFIARLAKSGFVKTVATTNFDVLIEKALKNEGLEEGIDFERYYTEEGFSAAESAEQDERFTLFKLHGSIDHPETVRATLNAVASQSLSKQRMRATRHLFSTGAHQAILILGYSCSDTFDLMPQILSIDTNDKKVFFIEHTEGVALPTVYDLRARRKRNPFRHFPGRWVKCSTDDLIKNLWSTVEGSIGKYEFVRSSFDWRPDVSAWLGEVQKDLGAKYFTAGAILENLQKSGSSHVQLFDKTRFYFERALEYAEDKKNIGGMMTCNARIGTVYWSWRDSGNRAIAQHIERAIEHHQKAFGFAQDLPAEISEYYAAGCCLMLGLDYESIKEFDVAKDWLKESQKHYRRMPDAQKIDANLIGTYVALGSLHLTERKPAEALGCFKKSFNLRKALDNESGIAPLCLNCGSTYLRLRRFDRAISCYQMSEKIAEEKGDIYTLNAVYKGFSDVYQAADDTESSQHYKQKLQLLEARMRPF